MESIVNPSGPSETLLETPVGAGEAHVDSLSLGMEYILQNWTDPFGNDQNEESGGENQNPWVENVPEAEDVGDTVEGQTELIEEGTQTDMTPSFSDFRSGPEVSDRSEFMKGCVFGIKMMRAAEQVSFNFRISDSEFMSQTDASRTPSLAILGDLCKIVEPRDRNTQILAPEVQNTFQTIRGPSVPNELGNPELFSCVQLSISSSIHCPISSLPTRSTVPAEPADLSDIPLRSAEQSESADTRTNK